MKARDEDSITSAIQQVSDRLPDLKVYSKIYPDPDLGLMMVEAYKDVILLAREATAYFQGSTWGKRKRSGAPDLNRDRLTSLERQLYSLGRPARFETMEQAMRANFNRLRVKCDMLLAQRVEGLEKEMEGKK